MTDSTDDRAAAGRRRGPLLDQAIFDAVWELLAESGYERLSMAAVAIRARTSKPVLYRRWANRAELTLATLRNKIPPPRFPHTDHGDLRSDLIAMLLPLANWLVDTPPDIVRSLRTAVLNDPELMRATQVQMAQVDLGPAMAEVMNRAAARGEADAGPVPPRVARLPVQLMRAESLHATPVPDHVVAEIVDQILLPLLTNRSGQ
jgi:AcrR family transcriptional regulator